MKWRRTFIGGLILVMSFITACGSNGNKDSSSASSAGPGANGKPSELVFFAVDVTQDKHAKFWKAFEDQNHVKIKLVTTTSAKFMESFMASHNAKQTIDVMNLNGQDVRYMATSGMIKDITETTASYTNRFNPAALNPYKLDGKVYAIPAGSMSTSAIYYNKKIFEKYNLQPPKTLAELVNVANTLKNDGISAISFNGKDIYMWPMWFFQTFAQTSGNKSVERTMDTLGGKAKFTEPDYVEAMKALQDFGKAEVYEPGVNGVDGTAAKAIFTTGKAAMFYGGTWEMAGFIQAAKDSGGKLDLGVTTFPVISSQEGIKPMATGGSGSGIAISSTIDPEKQQLAEKFIDYWTSDDVQQQMLDDAKGAFSVNLNVKPKDSNPIIDDLTNTFLDQTVTFLDWYWPPEITKAFQTNQQAVAGGQKDAEAAMAEIQKTFDDLVAKGYKF